MFQQQLEIKKKIIMLNKRTYIIFFIIFFFVRLVPMANIHTDCFDARRVVKGRLKAV